MTLSREASVESCVCEFYVYQDLWIPIIGETLPCHRETDNSEDSYTVAYYKSGEVVDHVSLKYHI